VAADHGNTELTVRRRIALWGGLGSLLLFMAMPVLTVLTHWFDGKLGPISAGYVAAAFAILFPLPCAYLYSRWADRRRLAQGQP